MSFHAKSWKKRTVETEWRNYALSTTEYSWCRMYLFFSLSFLILIRDAKSQASVNMHSNGHLMIVCWKSKFIINNAKRSYEKSGTWNKIQITWKCFEFVDYAEIWKEKTVEWRKKRTKHALTVAVSAVCRCLFFFILCFFFLLFVTVRIFGNLIVVSKLKCDNAKA